MEQASIDARGKEQEDLLTKYKARIQNGECEPNQEYAFGSGITAITRSSLAIIIVGARIIEVLQHMAVLMTVMIKEQQYFRRMTQGEIIREQDIQSKLIKPFEA